MKNQKIAPIIVTHAEILNYAIENMIEKWENAKAKARKLRDTEPGFAKEYLERGPWKDKLEIMLLMYKIETGEDYGYEINLD